GHRCLNVTATDPQSLPWPLALLVNDCHLLELVVVDELDHQYNERKNALWSTLAYDLVVDAWVHLPDIIGEVSAHMCDRWGREDVHVLTRGSRGKSYWRRAMGHGSRLADLPGDTKTSLIIVTPLQRKGTPGLNGMRVDHFNVVVALSSDRMARAAWGRQQAGARGVPLPGNGMPERSTRPREDLTRVPSKLSRFRRQRVVHLQLDCTAAVVPAHHAWISPYVRPADVTPSARSLMSVSDPS
ncbi:hypothetical protein MUK42_37783, partial [Musa troglodytarum]